MLVLTPSIPVVLKPAQTGANGGSIGAQAAGLFKIAAITINIASTIAATMAFAPFTTDVTGLVGQWEFAYDPTSQTLEAAFLAFLATEFSGVTFALSLA